MMNKNFLKLECTSSKFEVPWKLKDILIVFLISFIAILLSSSDYVTLFIALFLKDASSQRLLIYYIVGIIFLLTPIIWVKKIYKAKIEILGIRKGRWPLSLIVIVGLGVGVAYYFPTQAILGLPLDLNRFLTNNFYIAMLSKQIFNEIFDSALTPIAEEIVFRGFIYGYLRKRLGILFGLLIQSIVFTFLHLDLIISDPIPQIIHKFILGLILGVLYEISDSLYPSMICHGILNFLAVRIPVSMVSNL
jgi:hypothetical protein